MTSILSVPTTLTPKSDQLFAEAQRVMPGGVSSPVRAFRGVGGTPRFMVSGDGPYVTDADGNRYIDYVLSWGPLALGHTHPAVTDAIVQQARRGSTFGAPTELETELAQHIKLAMPSLEMVRFVSSGTEATMSAVRLARAVTGRSKIVKFAGCYHGHADAFLAQAGSGVTTLGLPDSPGVVAAVTADTLIAPYNDADAVASLCARHEVAAILVEPVAGNMGLVLPEAGFLAALRDIATRSGALLIFDEVMTGFRVAPGGAQELFGLTPDLTCLGKVIGGGLPAAAYGGRREYMMHVAPAGQMYQAGTLSGNPLAMAAGLATLQELARPGVFSALREMASALAAALQQEATQAGIPIATCSIGSMWGFAFTAGNIRNYDDARRLTNASQFATFFHAMLDAGVYLAPSAFESAFVSTAHTQATLSATISAFAQSLGRVRDEFPD